LNNHDGYLVIFAINDRNSFEYLNTIMSYISEYKKDDHKRFPLIIAGNKIDLEFHRAVQQNEADKFAEKCGVKYIEISAIENININEMFEDLANQLIKSTELDVR